MKCAIVIFIMDRAMLNTPEAWVEALNDPLKKNCFLERSEQKLASTQVLIRENTFLKFYSLSLPRHTYLIPAAKSCQVIPS